MPPISDNDILIALNKQDNEEWKRDVSDWRFYRRALNRELIGDKTKAVETAVQQKTLRQEMNPDASPSQYQNALRAPENYSESYLIRQPVESDLSYAIRLIFGFDGNESYKALRTLLGFLLRETSLNTEGMSPDLKERIENNIDGKGTDFDQFVQEAAEEIAGIGKSYGWIYQPTGDKIPVHEFVPREKVRDWHKDKTDFKYVKFEDCRENFVGVIRSKAERTVILTPEEWFYCTRDGEQDKWKIERVSPEFAGGVPFIPFVDGWCGSYGKSVIATAAYLQFLIMNADSVAFQIIRNQMLGIITGPEGTAKQLQEITTGTVVDVPPEATRGVEIVGFPKSTIDGHFEYLNNMSAKVSRSANLREEVALNASGESKDWDFMPTASVLELLAVDVENYVNASLTMFEKLSGATSPNPKRFSIKREFDKKGLKETLEVIFSGIALQLGNTMNDKLKKRAAEAFKQIGIEPTPEEWVKIENEIASLGRSSTLEKLMEVNINGQNTQTSGSTDEAGGGKAGDSGDGSGDQDGG